MTKSPAKLLLAPASLFYIVAALSVVTALSGFGSAYFHGMLAVTFLSLGTVFVTLSVMVTANEQLRATIARSESEFHRWSPAAAPAPSAQKLSRRH